MNSEQERVGKILKLTKHGVAGEKAAAIAILKKLCEKHRLDFDLLMTNAEEDVKVEHEISYRTADERRLLGQVIVKYAGTREFFGNRYRKVIIFDATAAQFVETQNAFDVLVKLYRREKRKYAEAVYFGFLEKHDLYAPPTGDAKQDELSEEELEKRGIGSMMSRTMQDAELTKRLEGRK